MNTAALSRDALIPRNPDGMGRGLLMALAVHALLLIAIAFGVSWRSSNPAGVEAELWAAVPQIAAPKPVEPEPTPPQPVKKPEPPPPPPKAETPKQDDAQIAIEKAKREAERQRKEEQLRREEELKRQKDEQQRKLAEAEKLKKEQAEQKRREAAEAAAAEKRRQENLQRMAALAGDGAPNSPGTAAKSAGPSASYAGKVIGRLKPLSVFTGAIAGNPKAEVEIRVSPDGTIISSRLVRSSGVPAWDDAVMRTIEKAGSLPRDTDGRVPNLMIIAWGPND